jgi:hypothetical protein
VSLFVIDDLSFLKAAVEYLGGRDVDGRAVRRRRLVPSWTRPEHERTQLARLVDVMLWVLLIVTLVTAAEPLDGLARRALVLLLQQRCP